MPRPTPEERAEEAARLASISWAEAERQRIRAHPRKTKVVTRAQATAAGLCAQCKWRDKPVKYMLCDHCREIKRLLSRKYAEQRHADGLCVVCGKNPYVPGYQRCEDCMEKHRLTVSGGRPRKHRNVPIGVLPPGDDSDAAILITRQAEMRAITAAHRAAVNAVTDLANRRDNDTELRWRCRALFASAKLLLEAL